MILERLLPKYSDLASRLTKTCIDWCSHNQLGRDGRGDVIRLRNISKIVPLDDVSHDSERRVGLTIAVECVVLVGDQDVRKTAGTVAQLQKQPTVSIGPGQI